MTDPAHGVIRGRTAVQIAESVEAAIRDGKLEPGASLPTVRDLARARGVSPATAAAAYRMLQQRGILVARGRQGTKVAQRAIRGPIGAAPVPPGIRDLSDGNPDVALLPDMRAALRAIDASPRLYGAPPHDESLVRLIARDLEEDGVPAGQKVVLSGAMDAIDRVLAEHARPGDRVIVEDPGFGNLHALAQSRGLSLLPAALDEEGILPGELDRACGKGARALIVTPRAQNPTGAALSESRSAELKKVLAKHPQILLIEDDHASLVCDAPLYGLHDRRRPAWAHVRSFAKSLNPDLRLALLTGDDRTLHRVQDRMLVGCRWVSHLLQRTAYALLSDAGVRRQLARAARAYARRREALRRALSERGVPHSGRSGFHLWIPVPAETPVIQALLAAGWMVAPGERFRIESPPAVRVTVASLQPEECPRLADDLAAAFSRQARTASA